jgi:hypothetical protein
MHTTKKIHKRKVLLRYSSPSNNGTSTTKTTPELQTLQKRRLQKGNSAQTSSPPDQKMLGFHPEDSPRFQNNASNKVIVRQNQLKPDLGFSS